LNTKIFTVDIAIKICMLFYLLAQYVTDIIVEICTLVLRSDKILQMKTCTTCNDSCQR